MFGKRPGRSNLFRLFLFFCRAVDFRKKTKARSEHPHRGAPSMQTLPLPEPPVRRSSLPFETRLLDGTAYKAVRPLGRGGMGEVFEAEHLGLKKRVVVKLLRPELCGDRSLVERLHIEAQALARLDHPGIVGVHDMGTTAEGRPFFVLDYLSGRTLADELKVRGTLPVQEALGLALEVLEALAAAHEAGLVHRDIKPSNVFLVDARKPTGMNGATAAGPPPRRVKLIDFGVVKVQSAPFDRAFPTEQGQFVGSPATASPEQARGEAVDPRSDLYAVGVLLYLMIAGKSPFPNAVIPRSALAAHVLDVPAPLSKRATQPIPHLLDLAAARALSKRAEERYASASVMAHILSHVLAKLPPAPPSPLAEVRLAERAGEPSGPPAKASQTPFGTDLLDPPGLPADAPDAVTVRPRGASFGPGMPAVLSNANAVPRRGFVSEWVRRLVGVFRKVPFVVVVAVTSTVFFFVALRILWSILGPAR